MKPKPFLILLFAYIAVSSLSFANPQSITNWGVAVCGIQMSITTRNGVISSDSPFALECMTKNSSSNLVVYAFSPDLEMQIFMTDESGITYNLSRDPNHFGPGGGGAGFTLHAGEVKFYTFPLTIKSTIKPGIYKFRTEIPLRDTIESTNQTVNYKYPKVVSNLLALRVDH